MKPVLVDGNWSCLAGSRCHQEITIGATPVTLLLLDLDAHAPIGQDLLTKDERHRMSRFHRDIDQRRFAARRLLLRQVLGELVGRPCDTITFEHGPQGKPMLPRPNRSKIEFNTSHSGRWFIIAWAKGVEVGVDIETETRNHLQDGPSLARRWLTSAEFEQATQRGLDFSGSGFLRLWCRKEAVMKATGLGLSLEPTSFEVPTDPVLEKPALVKIGIPETGCLQLMDITPGSWPVGLLGSVCVDVSRQATVC